MVLSMGFWCVLCLVGWAIWYGLPVYKGVCFIFEAQSLVFEAGWMLIGLLLLVHCWFIWSLGTWAWSVAGPQKHIGHEQRTLKYVGGCGYWSPLSELRLT